MSKDDMFVSTNCMNCTQIHILNYALPHFYIGLKDIGLVVIIFTFILIKKICNG